MQHDLFPRVQIGVAPQVDRVEPRLWVRSLHVWSEPEKLIRRIDLRPGLNIVWSPDGDASGRDPIGHGGGKTTFCRMLRYCLGEDSFATDVQRRRILEKFPAGLVGAEIMIDGTCWAVVRPFGRREPTVVKAAHSIDDALKEGAARTTFADFKQAFADKVVGASGDLMPASIPVHRRWEAVLAWLTRDQECRLRHHFEWRDPDTGSHSPVGGRSKEDVLAIVRAALGAVSVEELRARAIEESRVAELGRLKTELARFEWQIMRAGRVLSRIFGGKPEGTTDEGFDVLILKQNAKERLRAALDLPALAATDIASAREERDRAAVHLRDLEDRQIRNDLRIEAVRRMMSLVRSELPEESAQLDRNRNPVCPICKVPLDAVLTAGCQLATDCDMNELEQRVRARQTEIADLGLEAEQLRIEVLPLKGQIAAAKQTLERTERTVSRLEELSFSRSIEIREAERIGEEISRFEELIQEREEMEQAVADNESSLAQSKAASESLRRRHASVVEDLSTKFDGVIRELVSGDVSGRVVLDGKGLSLKVRFGGDRSTAAIESWKIVAFDIATLVMSIEGSTCLPGFLLHDSPREADLGMSLYERLFKFMGRLEKVGPAPLFQYIVTTTTEPPEEFRQEPWLRMELRGAPANERFLRIDL